MARQIYLNVWNVLLIVLMLNIVAAFSFAQGQVSPGNPHVNEKAANETAVADGAKNESMSSGTTSSDKTDEFNMSDIEDLNSMLKYANATNVMQCINNETKDEIANLYLRYRNAVQNRNNEMVPSLRDEALALKERVMEQVSACQTNTVQTRQQELNQEMRQVVSTYVERIQNLSSISDNQLRNQVRDQIKQETMAQVKAIVANRSTVDANEILPIANRIHLSANSTQLGDETINVTNISVTARIRDRIMNITQMQQRLNVIENGVQASVGPNLDISITENGTTIGGKALEVTPLEAKERLRNMVVSKLEIKTEAGNLIYQADGEENRKLLGIFQIKVQTTAQISAENGETLKVERPWWAFLTTE